jgi:hypothetical protein
MRIAAVFLIAVVPLSGCGWSASSLDPEDPEVIAQIESQLQSAMAGAAAADAGRVLAIAAGQNDLTFITLSTPSRRRRARAWRGEATP